MAKLVHSSRVDDTYRIVKDELTSSQQSEQHRGNRHGRSEAARQAVLQAADDLLVRNGFGGVTIEGIAAAAGVGKQTIYRWWSSKTDVLLDAFLEDAAEQLMPPDLGNLGADLLVHLRNCAEFLAKSDAGAVFRALIGESQHDPALASRLRSQYLQEQRRRDHAPFQRAIERGELSPDVDVERAIDQLIAPLYYRILVTGEAVTPEYTDLLVQKFLTQLQQF